MMVQSSEEMVQRYLPLVRQVVRKMSHSIPPHASFDDLESMGILGLLDAIQKFDTSKGSTFETYATWRIRGAVLDGLRQSDWVPRQVRVRAKQFEKAYRELEHQHLRSVDDHEVAEYLGISVDQFNRDMQETALYQVVSLEDLFYSDGQGSTLDRLQDFSLPDPQQGLERAEWIQLLTQAVEKLPDREKLVVSLFYFDELSFKDIASVLEISASRVSQLHTKAIYRLRGSLSRKRKEFR